jgi:hypothetical protein
MRLIRGTLRQTDKIHLYRDIIRDEQEFSGVEHA